VPPEEAATLQPLLRCNVGFVLDERDDAIVLAAGIIYDQDSTCMGCEWSIVISRGMIVEVRKLFFSDGDDAAP
jgi:hypothetical protein